MAANKSISVAFATCLTSPELATDDITLARALTAAGYTVQAAPWDDPGIDWKKFTAVVIRSTWNYHLHATAFRAWLHRLKSLKLRIFNPVDILEWNMDKSYLDSLQAQGIPLPPTRFLDADAQDPDESPSLENIFTTTGWKKAVIKPCISATAYNTWITNPATAEADQPRLEQLLKTGKYLIQEFMEEVETDGEYSLMFFGQQYSHAVKKTVKKGDFRVQEKFGGASLPIQPDPALIRQAAAILEKAVSGVPPLLYARVDGVVHKDVFTLMELELVEPSLFINDHPLAIEQFVYFFNSSFTAASIC